MIIAIKVLLYSVYSCCITDILTLLYCLYCSHFLWQLKNPCHQCMTVHFCIFPNFSLLKYYWSFYIVFEGKTFKFIVLLQTSLKVKSTQENYSPKVVLKTPMFYLCAFQFHVIKKYREQCILYVPLTLCPAHSRFYPVVVWTLSTHCASHSAVFLRVILWALRPALLNVSWCGAPPPTPRCKCRGQGPGLPAAVSARPAVPDSGWGPPSVTGWMRKYVTGAGVSAEPGFVCWFFVFNVCWG